jgi:hypothetical protein
MIGNREVPVREVRVVVRKRPQGTVPVVAKRRHEVPHFWTSGTQCIVLG